MKNSLLFSLIGMLLVGLGACNNTETSLDLIVSNSTDLTRNEIVSVKKSEISEFLKERDLSDILVREKGDSVFLVRQLVDNDQDTIMDELLFMAGLRPHQAKAYELVFIENGRTFTSELENVAYSRFVPERTDDYTWENDKVAFRTYGPTAQQMVEQRKPGGTLSSGIDLWLKRVPYSIIDKWYAGYLKSPNFYHTDIGEGYDPYHVGSSRGTGGIGVWEEDRLVTSRNFTAYRTIANGPLRTTFELDYAPWSKYGIKETKRISLDLGSNFSKFEITLSSDSTLPNAAIGITLHEKEGEVQLQPEKGIFRHWEAIDSSFVGEGIVINPSYVTESFAHETNRRDQSQIIILTQPKVQKLVYYAGFAWTKSKQVSKVSEWDKMLNEQAIIHANPLKVEFK